MKNKFFILCTSVMLLTSGFASNALANENVDLQPSTNVCSASKISEHFDPCCFYPDPVYVSPTRVVCKYCGKVLRW